MRKIEISTVPKELNLEEPIYLGITPPEVLARNTLQDLSHPVSRRILKTMTPIEISNNKVKEASQREREEEIEEDVVRREVVATKVVVTKEEEIKVEETKEEEIKVVEIKVVVIKAVSNRNHDIILLLFKIKSKVSTYTIIFL